MSVDERADRPFTLLFVAHSMQRGGAERTLFNIMSHCARARFELLLAAPDGPMLDAFRPLSRAVVALRGGYVPLSFDLVAYARALYAMGVNYVRLRRFLRDRPVDLVFTNTGVIVHGAAAAVASGIPSVTMVHEIVSPPLVRAMLFRLLVRVNQRIVVVSQAVRRLFDGFRGPDVVMIRGGIEPPADHSSAADTPPALRGLPPDAPLVGVVGTVGPVKGQDYFLRMVADVIRRVPRAKFLVVGGYRPGSCYYRRLLRLRRRLGLEEAVIFTGSIERIEAVMPRLHVLVVPSMMESLSLVSLEAMAAGKPVVAFRVGGIAEVVEDGVTGRLVPFGDVPALAAAVCDLLQRPEQAARMGAAGRTKAAREFNAADQCRQIESLIRTMLARS